MLERIMGKIINYNSDPRAGELSLATLLALVPDLTPEAHAPISKARRHRPTLWMITSTEYINAVNYPGLMLFFATLNYELRVL